MELWRGTIAHHSAVIYRNDTRPFRPFDGERWPRYVPLRLPGTVCVRERERLPAGAAAVVLNRGHLHHDLIVPLDDRELRMYEAIDGRRTIAAIAEMAAGASRDGTLPRPRALFEKLWNYDQVIFDVSGTGD